VKPINFKIFDGRSVYSHRRCIRINLNLEGYDGITSNQLHNFNEALVNLMPQIKEHRCSLEEAGGFLKKLKEGTCLHHICGHMAIALQNMIGLEVSYCSESSPGDNSHYTLYEYKYKNTGVEAGNIAIEIINLLLEGKTLYLSEKLTSLKKVLLAEQRTEETLRSSNNIEKTKIPVVAITGTNGKTTTTRLIAYVISKAGYNVGMTTTDGIYINGNCIFKGDTTGPVSARTVLENSEIDMAVLETARGGMIRDGLAYDLADVAVITNIADDHLGLDGIETLEDLARVKSLVGEAVKPDGYVVMNGDNKMSVSIIDRIKSALIVFSEDRTNEALIKNINSGGYGIYVHKGFLCIESRNNMTELMPVEDIGITVRGALKYNIQNAMAACGALIGFGIEPSIIKSEFEAFQCNEELNPGRFNTFDVGGVLTILDYGHNVDGYSSVLEGLSNMKHNRIIGVIGVPGDRLNRTTVEVGRIAGSYFDYIFIKEDKDKRERLPGEVAELLKEGVLSSGFNKLKIKVALDEEEALSKAMDMAVPGDIVIVFFEHYEPLMKLVKERIKNQIRQPLMV
jgi:UDP-N-acetylmuramyl tripeptide synthase